MVPMMEMMKKNRIMNDMNRTLDSVENGYRLYILGDLN